MIDSKGSALTADFKHFYKFIGSMNTAKDLYWKTQVSFSESDRVSVTTDEDEKAFIDACVILVCEFMTYENDKKLIESIHDRLAHAYGNEIKVAILKKRLHKEEDLFDLMIKNK